MRILQIIRSVDPQQGGTIEAVRQYGRELVSLRHSVDVLSLDEPKAPFLAQFPLPVHALGPARDVYGFSPRFVPWLTAHASDYDCVVVNGIWQYHSYGAWKALRTSKVPYFVFPHGMLDPWFKRTYPLKHVKKWMYWPWADYRVLRDARAVLYTCEEERALARESFWLYRAKEAVTNLGTAAPNRSPEQEREAFFAMYPVLRGKRLALSMGRIHPKKGCDLLIEAFAASLACDPEWHLVIAGPDQVNWRLQLEEMAAAMGISDRITWTGMITGNVKAGAIEAAEIFVLPSHQENFGFVVAEALARGVPALVSKQVNIWRDIVDDGAGLAATDNVESTAEMLRDWMRLSKDERNRFGRQAQLCFNNRFEIRRATEALVDVLRTRCDLATER